MNFFANAEKRLAHIQFTSLLLTVSNIICFSCSSSDAIDVDKGRVDFSLVDYSILPRENADMVKMYRDTFLQAKPDLYYFLNSSRVQLYAEKDKMVQGTQRFQFLYNYASELLFAGKTKACRDQLHKLVEMMHYNDEDIQQENAQVYELMGLSYIYEAQQIEKEADVNLSRLFLLKESYDLSTPIVQTLQSAQNIFRQLSKLFPENQSYHWINRLLNAWISNGFANDLLTQEAFLPYALKFRETSDKMGIQNSGMIGGLCVEDFNRDGTYDIISGSIGINDPLFYYEADSYGFFTLRSKEAFLEGSIGGMSIIQGDYNNDDYPDVYVVRGGTLLSAGKQPNSLLRNNKDGTFTDVTVQAGLLDFHPGHHAHFVDYDNDGHLDIFVANESMTEYFRNAHPCQLYHNNGDGTFIEIGGALGLEISQMVKGSTWLDVNNDGWLDLYVSVSGDSNRLYVNKVSPTGSGKRLFEKVPHAGGASLPIQSGYCTSSDVNQDGWEDLMVFQMNQSNTYASFLNPSKKDSHFSMQPTLFLNQGDGAFKKVDESWMLDYPVMALNGATGDLNNNGYPDFYVGTGNTHLKTIIPNTLILNSGTSLPPGPLSSGTAFLGKTHGIQMADFNKDGKLDILASMGGFYESERHASALMLNESHTTNSWVEVRLKGKIANKQGVGSLIKIITQHEDGIEHSWFHRISTGNSPSEVHIGLGDAKKIRELEIQWADATGKVQTLHNLSVNQRMTIQQK